MGLQTNSIRSLKTSFVAAKFRLFWIKLLIDQINDLVSVIFSSFFPFQIESTFFPNNLDILKTNRSLFCKKSRIASFYCGVIVIQNLKTVVLDHTPVAFSDPGYQIIFEIHMHPWQAT